MMDDNQLDNLLEQLLTQEQARHVADAGFSERVLMRIPSGSRRSSRWTKIFPLGVGIVLAALLPNGTNRVYEAVLQLLHGQANASTVLLAIVPFAVLISLACSTLVQSERP